MDFYSGFFEGAGLKFIKPNPSQVEELQIMIFQELTQDVVTERSRRRFFEIASDGQERGGEVVGLCCAEFGLFVQDQSPPWPFLDSTEAHVSALPSF